MAHTTRRGDRTREEILAAATDVVLEAGPDAFSLREVARRASLAPSAVYNHFASRDDLVVAIALRALAELSAYLEAVPSSARPADRLRALARAYVAFAADRSSEYRLIFDCLNNPPTDWETYLVVAHPFSLIVDACADGLAAGDFRDRAGVGAGGMAYGLWALVHGHASLTARNLAHVEGEFGTLLSAAIESMLAGWASSEQEA